MKRAVLSFSGGMDSTGVLLKILSKKTKIKAISFDYGQKHLLEIKKATQLISYLNDTTIYQGLYMLSKRGKEGGKYLTN